jgi:hypothetical protein
MKSNLTAAIAALGLIITAFVLANAYKYRFRSAEEISVVGLAEVDFTSDLIVWNGSFERKAMNLRDAYTALKNDETAIRTYLKEKGVPDSSVVISAVSIDKEFENAYDSRGNVASVFSGYKLSQRVKIQSKDMDRVEALSRQVTELIEKGIEFKSEAPRYYYTQLANLKMDLLAKASEDAKLRAETIARSVNSSLAKLKKANMGVFQITGKNSDEDYSYGGTFNTADKQKTASITIRMDYRLN